jgi:hypothetical protein
MTRTIQTATLAFGHLIDRCQSDNLSLSKNVEVQIWPELRETHDGASSKGLSRVELKAKFPRFDFSACNELWDYPPHNTKNATTRAEEARRRLSTLSKSYKNIILVTHAGFIRYLVEGPSFGVCGMTSSRSGCIVTSSNFQRTEVRPYRFAAESEVENLRYGLNHITGNTRDFGPTLLLPSLRGDETSIEGREATK